MNHDASNARKARVSPYFLISLSLDKSRRRDIKKRPAKRIAFPTIIRFYSRLSQSRAFA